MSDSTLTPRDEITPAMIKAAWVVARRFWPSKVVEYVPCKACGQTKGLRLLETSAHVTEPTPGFREAITAALKARDSASVGEANTTTKELTDG